METELITVSRFIDTDDGKLRSVFFFHDKHEVPKGLNEKPKRDGEFGTWVPVTTRIPAYVEPRSELPSGLITNKEEYIRIFHPDDYELTLQDALNYEATGMLESDEHYKERILEVMPREHTYTAEDLGESLGPEVDAIGRKYGVTRRAVAAVLSTPDIISIVEKKQMEYYIVPTVPVLPGGGPNPEHPGFKAFVRPATEVRWEKVGEVHKSKEEAYQAVVTKVGPNAELIETT